MSILKMTKAILLSASIAVMLVQPAVSQGDQKSTAILDAMSSKYQSMKSFKALFTYTPDGGQSMKGDVTVKGSKYKLKMAGQEIYNDGKLMATYIKETNEVNLQDFDPSAAGELDPTKIYTAYKKGFKHTFVQEKKQGNTVVDVVELTSTNKNSQVAKVQLWISKVDKSIKGWKIFQKNGQKVNYEVQLFQPNVTVADKDFTFNSKLYPGVEVVDLR